MDSPERAAEAGWLHRLDPEAEGPLARGREPEPYVRSEVVDPVVALLRSGQNLALAGPTGVGERSVARGLRRSCASDDALVPERGTP